MKREYLWGWSLGEAEEQFYCSAALHFGKESLVRTKLSRVLKMYSGLKLGCERDDQRGANS